MNLSTYLKKIHVRPLLTSAALVALALLTPLRAHATPSCALASVTLATGHFPDGSLNLMCDELQAYGWRLRTKIKGDSDLYVVQNTWPVGAHSGWHTHPGPSMIIILSGELTVYEADDPTCTPKVYHAGDSFTDLGCGDVHLIRNEGTECAVNIVVQIVPAGQPRRIDAEQPANCVVPTCAAPTPTPCPQ
jgi:quercetin dioxygenase-like cupin family protein